MTIKSAFVGIQSFITIYLFITSSWILAGDKAVSPIFSLPIELGMMVASELSMDDLAHFAQASQCTHTWSIGCVKANDLDLSKRVIEDDQFMSLFGDNLIFKNLKHLRLAYSSFNHDLLINLPATLESLDLTSCMVDGEDLQLLAHVKGLRRLLLNFNSIDAFALSVIAEQFPKLEVLQLRRDRYGDRIFLDAPVLAEITKLKKLRYLDLSFYQSQGGLTDPLLQLPLGLQVLKLSDCILTVDELKTLLKELINLTHLDVNNNMLIDDTIVDFIKSNFPKLISLNLSAYRTISVLGNTVQTGIGSLGTEKVLGMRSLKYLGLGGVGNGVGSEALRLILMRDNFVQLDLSGSELSDQDWIQLGKRYPKLKGINLAGTSVPVDAYPEILSHFPEVENLGLNGAPLNIISATLNSLQNVKKVYFDSFGVYLTEGVRENLSMLYPDIEFNFSWGNSEFARSFP